MTYLALVEISRTCRYVAVDCYAVRLSAVLLLALYLRANGLMWGFPHGFNVDENLTISLAERLKGHFLSDGSLDPKASAYGTLPLYLMIISTAIATETANWLKMIVPLPFNSVPMLYVGRLLSVMASVATVWITAEVGRRLFGKVVGLLSALFLAVCLLAVREAHFATVDSLLASLIMVTLLAGEKIARRGGWRDYIVVGISAAMAMATKITAVILLPAILLAHGYRQRRIGKVSSRHSLIQSFLQAVGGLPPLATMIGLILVVWLALNPFLLLNPSTYFDIENNAAAFTQWLVVRGDLPVLYTLQFENTIPYLYVITNLLLWGMGLPLETLALAGVAYAVWRLVRPIDPCFGPEDKYSQETETSRFADAYLLTWVFAYFLVTGAWHAKFIRYALPLIPVLCILASRLLVDVYQRGKPMARRVGAVVGVGVATSALAYTCAYLQIYRQPDVRLTAASWLERHIPPGASIFVENDAGLFFHQAEYRYRLKGYRWKVWNPYEVDGVRGVYFQAPVVSEDQTRRHLGSLLTTDYAVLSSFWYERFTAAVERFPAQADFYRRLFNGETGYRLIQKFQVYPQVGPLVWRDDKAEITFRLFDHPAIYVFEKTAPSDGSSASSRKKI